MLKKMNQVTFVMMISFLTNFLLSCLKIIVGTIGKSSALIADGIHSFSDLSTDVVAIIGNHLALKPADKEHPYGHGKSEYLTNLVIGTIVLFLGFGVISNAMKKEIAFPSVIVMYVSIFTIFCKFLLSTYLISSGKKLDNTILLSSGKESSADMFSSLVVLIASIFMQLKNYCFYFQYADIIATVIVGIFVVHTGYSILKENMSVILERQDADISRQEQIKTEIRKNKYVKGIDNFVLVQYGPYSRLSLEVSMDGNLTLKKAHIETHKIESSIKKIDDRIRYVTIHPNVYEKSSKEKD